MESATERGPSEAPLKRKTADPDDPLPSKKPRESSPEDVAATPERVDGGASGTAGNVSELKSFSESGGSCSAALDCSGTDGTGEVLVEERLEAPQEENREEGFKEEVDIDPDVEEEDLVSEIDSEDNEEEEDEQEDDDDDEDDDEEDGSDEDSDEENKEEDLAGISFHAETKDKSKGKGKLDDSGVKGKGVMVDDKGKGKAKVDSDNEEQDDEDDAGYLSEDPLDEVDLNNIVSSRTRKSNSSVRFNAAELGDEEDDDDDDDDSDA